MKKLILTELLLLFLATTFMTDSLPPGWYQQILPRSDVIIQDIFFLDSLTGHVVARKNTNDSAFIFKTIDGGNSWITTLRENIYLTSIQFANNNTGYSVGSAPGGIIKKTTNGGLNWYTVNLIAPYPLLDLSFVNKDTGWVCSTDLFAGGIYKTLDGGLNWTQQLGAGFSIKKLFFINSDTGWAGSADWKLYRTTNSGQVWVLQYTSNGAVESIFFLNSLKGWIRGGTGNGVAYTTDGGLNWTSAQGDPAGYDMKFVNDSIGYSGMIDFRIMKSTNGGKNWGYQNSPIISNLSVSMLRTDTLHGWAGGIGFIKSTDGGGPITFTGIQQISTEIPSDFKLYQNYPNPFNPVTSFKLRVSSLSNIQIKVYDINGKLMTILVNKQMQAGEYLISFDGTNYSSGIYFYSLIADEKLIETRRMILIK